MLTVRLQCEGVLSAFQTNRVVSLVLAGSKEMERLLAEYPAASPAVFDAAAGKDGAVHVTAITDRIGDGSPAAFIKLDGGRHEMGDGTGHKSYVEGARFICLYEGDSVYVLDSGAKLFGWPVAG